jgi:hypothetical protein
VALDLKIARRNTDEIADRGGDMAGDVQESGLRTADRGTEGNSGDHSAPTDASTTQVASRKTEPSAVTGPRPEEVARAAAIILTAVADRVVRWPAGVISLVGSLLAMVAVGAELWEFDPLNTTEFVTTVIVGAILALAGPLVIGVDRAGARSLAKEVADTTRSQAEQASQETEDRATRILLDNRMSREMAPNR